MYRKTRQMLQVPTGGLFTMKKSRFRKSSKKQEPPEVNSNPCVSSEKGQKTDTITGSRKCLEKQQKTDADNMKSTKRPERKKKVKVASEIPIQDEKKIPEKKQVQFKNNVQRGLTDDESTSLSYNRRPTPDPYNDDHDLQAARNSNTSTIYSQQQTSQLYNQQRTPVPVKIGYETLQKNIEANSLHKESSRYDKPSTPVNAANMLEETNLHCKFNQRVISSVMESILEERVHLQSVNSSMVNMSSSTNQSENSSTTSMENFLEESEHEQSVNSSLRPVLFDAPWDDEEEGSIISRMSSCSIPIFSSDSSFSFDNDDYEKQVTRNSSYLDGLSPDTCSNPTSDSYNQYLAPHHTPNLYGQQDPSYLNDASERPTPDAYICHLTPDPYGQQSTPLANRKQLFPGPNKEKAERNCNLFDDVTSDTSIPYFYVKESTALSYNRHPTPYPYNDGDHDLQAEESVHDQRVSSSLRPVSFDAPWDDEEEGSIISRMSSCSIPILSSDSSFSVDNDDYEKQVTRNSSHLDGLSPDTSNDDYEIQVTRNSGYLDGLSPDTSNDDYEIQVTRNSGYLDGLSPDTSNDDYEIQVTRNSGYLDGLSPDTSNDDYEIQITRPPSYFNGLSPDASGNPTPDSYGQYLAPHPTPNLHGQQDSSYLNGLTPDASENPTPDPHICHLTPVGNNPLFTPMGHSTPLPNRKQLTPGPNKAKATKICNLFDDVTSDTSIAYLCVKESTAASYIRHPTPYPYNNTDHEL